MKTTRTFRALLLVALLAASNIASGQGTAFTYQGRLTDNNGPANGIYDFTFTLYGSQSGGSAVSGSATNAAVFVTNGVFTARLDFGAAAFTGPDRWLEIGVRTNGAGAFTALSPRQAILPTPYAMHASNADLLDGMNFTAFAQAAHSHSAGDIVSGVLAPARGGTGIDTSATPAGSLLRTTGTGTWSPLAPGANGQVLKIAGGQLVWSGDNDSGGTVTSVNTGTGLTGGPITTSGTIAIDTAVVPRLGANNTFTASNIFTGVIVATNASNSFAGTFSGSGNALSNLNASALTGALPGGGIAGTYSNAVAFNNSANNFNGSFTGNGLGLSNVNARTLNGLAAPDFWQLAGNSVLPGQFLGSTNNQAVEIRVNGQRALRLEPNTNEAPNVIGGSSLNRADPGVSGATIGGGGFATSSGGFSNRVTAGFDTIAGGAGNLSQGGGSFIGGGYVNVIETNASQTVIAGGSYNVIRSGSYFANVLGGYTNVIGNNAVYAAIGGGIFNVIDTNSAGSFIGSGYQNSIGIDAGFSSIGGGFLNTNAAGSSVIGGGNENRIEPTAGLSVIGGGWLNVIETGADQSVIGGGNAGKIRAGARESFIGGGFANTIGTNAGVSFIGGGTGNTVGTNSIWSAIVGGQNNSVQLGASHATIGGGTGNTITGGGGFIGGGILNRAENLDAVVVGGGGNVNAGYRAFIGSGQDNSIQTNAAHATIGGGTANIVTGGGGFIGGGIQNRADNFDAVVAGGAFNNNAGVRSFIGSGEANGISNSTYTAIAAGFRNTVLPGANAGAIGGGSSNSVGQTGATVPGGVRNAALGNASFAAGYRARAQHNGAFVWADGTDATFSSTAPNQFLIRASGGVGIGVSNPGAALDVAGSVRAGAFEGNGSGLTSLSGGNLAPGSVGAGALGNNIIASGNIVDGSVIPADLQTSVFSTTFWKVDGNAGTTAGAHFVGTTDNQALELKVGNMRALRLEPSSGAPNVIGGSPANAVALGVRGVFIGGGEGNVAGGDGSTVAGGVANQAAANHASVGGGLNNRSTGPAATVGGGEGNIGGDHAVVGGGMNNVSGGFGATVAGGRGNASHASHSTVGGGSGNTSQNDGATIGGGESNLSSGVLATIGGGGENVSSGPSATVSGGTQNTSRGQHATVPGGNLNEAIGNYGFAAGRRAKANHAGSFVWADSIDADLISTADNQFSVRASGGVRLSLETPNLSFDGANTSILFPATTGANAPMVYMFGDGTGNSPRMVFAHSPAYPNWGLQYEDTPDKFHFLSEGIPVMTVDLGFFNRRVGIGTASPTSALDVAGEVRATVFTPTSDRAAKENFQPIDALEVLAKVVALPVTRWNFKTIPEVGHIGPVAQDFHRAFSVGTDDKHISTVDADGVALAAIQGLNQKVEEQAAELRGKEAELRTVKQRLNDLEKLMTKLAAGR